MRGVVLVSILLLLGGCSASERLALGDPVLEGVSQALAPLSATAGLSCATVASHSTTVGEAFTRSIADEAVAYRIAESRGQLMQQGLRRVRVAQRRTTCEQHLYLGPGMQEYHCVAEARICGS